MKTVITILFFLTAPLISFSQAYSNYIKLGTGKNFPMKDCDVLMFNRDMHLHNNSIQSVVVESSNDSIWFGTTGKVLNVVSFENDDYTIIIKSYSGLFFSYTNLSKSFVNRGDEIKTGSLIGMAKIDAEKEKYNLVMTITGAASKYYSEDKIWQFIKDQNVQECDATKLNSNTKAGLKKINIKTEVQ